jgi:hypothetical protein
MNRKILIIGVVGFVIGVAVNYIVPDRINPLGGILGGVATFIVMLTLMLIFGDEEI